MASTPPPGLQGSGERGLCRGWGTLALATLPSLRTCPLCPPTPVPHILPAASPLRPPVLLPASRQPLGLSTDPVFPGCWCPGRLRPSPRPAPRVGWPRPPPGCLTALGSVPSPPCLLTAPRWVFLGLWWPPSPGPCIVGASSSPQRECPPCSLFQDPQGRPDSSLSVLLSRPPRPLPGLGLALEPSSPSQGRTHPPGVPSPSWPSPTLVTSAQGPALRKLVLTPDPSWLSHPRPSSLIHCTPI